MVYESDDLPDLDELRASGLDDREVAFQVWALFAEQSPKKTLAILEERYEITVNPSTLRQWTSRHNWRGRLRELLHDVAPTEMDRAALSLLGGAADAAAYLSAAARGEAEASRDRINASIAVLDRVGFLPHTRKEAKHTGVNAAIASGDTAELSMTDEELRAIVGGRPNFAEVIDG